MSGLTVGLQAFDLVKGRLDRYQQDLNKSLDRATAVAARAVRNAVRAELRTPGTGTEYPSRRGRVGLRVEREIEGKQQTLLSRVGKGGGLLSDRALRNVERSLKSRQLKLTRIRKKQGQRPDDLHTASVVGRAPAPDVGLMPQAVKAGKVGTEFRVGVGGKWEGWEALHEGRGVQRGPRPFLTLGIARIKDRLANIYVRMVEKQRPTA